VARWMLFGRIGDGVGLLLKEIEVQIYKLWRAEILSLVALILLRELLVRFSH